MCSYDGQQLVVLQELTAGGVAVEEAAASDGVMGEMLVCFLVAVVFEGIGPEEVAHGTERWWLLEAVQAANVL